MRRSRSGRSSAPSRRSPPSRNCFRTRCASCGMATSSGSVRRTSCRATSFTWGREALDLPRLDEIPFDSDRKRLSTVHRAPEGPVLYVKGAPEVILPRCRHVLVETGAEPLTAELAGTFASAHRAMAAVSAKSARPAAIHRISAKKCVSSRRKRRASGSCFRRSSRLGPNSANHTPAGLAKNWGSLDTRPARRLRCGPARRCPACKES